MARTGRNRRRFKSVLSLWLWIGAPATALAQPTNTPSVPVGGSVEPMAAPSGTPSVPVGHSIDELAGNQAPDAAAEEHGEAGAEIHHDPSKSFNFFDFGWKSKTVDGEPKSAPFILMLVNFAILLGILIKFGAPVARNAARKRSDQIKDALEESAKLRQAAAAKLDEYQSKLKAADDEIRDMVAKMKSDAEAEKARILAAADAQAKALEREAQARIAAEIERARMELQRQVATAAAAAAEKILRERITAADQTKLVDGFIADVQTAAIRGGASAKGSV